MAPDVDVPQRAQRWKCSPTEPPRVHEPLPTFASPLHCARRALALPYGGTEEASPGAGHRGSGEFQASGELSPPRRGSRHSMVRPAASASRLGDARRRPSRRPGRTRWSCPPPYRGSRHSFDAPPTSRPRVRRSGLARPGLGRSEWRVTRPHAERVATRRAVATFTTVRARLTSARKRRCSRIRRESQIASRPRTSTGTTRWPVSASISSRSPRRHGTRRSSNS